MMQCFVPKKIKEEKAMFCKLEIKIWKKAMRCAKILKKESQMQCSFEF